MQLNSSSVAIVTGGGSGLGGATARRFVADGAKVVILDLESSGGPALVGELGGDKVAFVAADVRDEVQVQAAIDRAKELGEVRVAVNCAGVATPGRIVGRQGPLALDTFRTVVDINLVGSFNVTRLAAARMAQNEPDDSGERGLVVHTASIAAFDGQIGQVAYAAAKSGLVGLTLPLAPDLAAPAGAASDAQSDIVQALVALGYNEREAAAALKALPADVGVADGIKLALKALSK